MPRNPIPVLAALVVLSTWAAVAPAKAGAAFPVPSKLKKAVNARKAELGKLKVGLQPFRHFYKARLDQMGVTAYLPMGEPVTFDFSTSFPPGWESSSANGVGAASHQSKGDTARYRLGVPGDRWDQFRRAASSYSFQARVKILSIEEGETWGIYLDSSDDGFYFLKVKRSGQAGFAKHDGKQWHSLMAWTEVPGGLAKDGWDTLKVERQGNKLHCFVNGKQVFSVSDDSLRRGVSGVFLNDRAEFQVDDVVIQNLAVSQAEVTAGSGYDYTEEVLAGLVDSGLFSAAQVGISNDPVSEPWDFTAGSEQLDARGTAALKYFVGRGGDEKLVLNESLDLPREWGTKSGRIPTMTRFGEYLAYRVAAQALGVAWEGKP